MSDSFRSHHRLIPTKQGLFKIRPIRFWRDLRAGSEYGPEVVRYCNASPGMCTALAPDLTNNSKLVLDDVHSFVLRLHLNPAPGGRGNPRPQFNLEHVNQGTNRRMQSLDEVLKELADRIELILQKSEGGVT